MRHIERPVRFAIMEEVGLTEREPGYWLGTLQILGQDHHIAFMRVEEDEDSGELRAWVPEHGVNDAPPNHNEERLDDLLTMENVGDFDKCELPGVEGEFVCWIVPYGR